MKVISLFAGCGGLDKGFEKAGFEIIWANEIDSSIHETYRRNHPKTILNTLDIRNISTADIPYCDGIIGGPPCQAWSEGGNNLGIEDPRGQLFLEFIRIVQQKLPKFFLIENVKGILEEKHRDSLNYFLSKLNEAGYQITYELLNAANYNIPQDRYRVFFVGIRNDIKVDFCFPDAITKKPVTLLQAIGDIKEQPHYYTKWIDSPNYNIPPNHDVYIGPYDKKYMARNRVRTWEETSFTIQAQARNAPQHPQAPKMTYKSNDERCFVKGCEHLYRRLSVRECARIQSFPDSFKFYYKDINDGYKMVGNAVPPRLAYYLALQITKAFSLNNKETKKKSILQPIPVCKLKQKQVLFTCKIESRRDYFFNYLSDETLIGLVKNDYCFSFMQRSATKYYTGRSIPSNLNIYNYRFFIPYIKGKGIRDIYLIKEIYISSKNDIDKTARANDLRVFFNIEFIKELTTDYIPIHLDIWHTYSSTSVEKILNICHCDF